MPSDPITSASNPRLLAAARLRDGRQRRDTGLSLVDGQREIARAAAAGVEIIEVFVDPAASSTPPDWLQRLEARGTRVTPAHGAAFARVAFGDRNEGCVAVVRFSGRTLGETPLPADRPVLVVEGIEKPGNLGAILRTADAAGLGGVIACGGGTDPANPATIRASLGTVFSVPVATAPTAGAIEWCAAHGRRVVAATPTGATLWHAADLTGPVVLLLGSEARGIAPDWSAAAAAGRLRLDTVRLPMHGAADSLNVAATAAVLAYEALRQEDARPRRSPEDRSR
jgi:TrmH family RNA methyltransferase